MAACTGQFRPSNGSRVMMDAVDYRLSGNTLVAPALGVATTLAQHGFWLPAVRW